MLQQGTATGILRHDFQRICSVRQVGHVGNHLFGVVDCQGYEVLGFRAVGGDEEYAQPFSVEWGYPDFFAGDDDVAMYRNCAVGFTRKAVGN